MSDIRGTEDKPVFMRMSMDKPGLADLARAVALTAIPVGIAILMQRPDMRKLILMRATNATKETCFSLGEWFNQLGLKAATAYQKATM